MSNVSESMLRRLDAFNNWLGDVFGEETNFSTLLSDADFSDVEVEQLKSHHLSAFLQAVMDLLAGYAEYTSEQRDNWLVQQYYGLVDGNPQSLEMLGANAGVARERIWQLVNRNLNLYHDPDRQAKFHEDFAAIGHWLINVEGNNHK